MIKKKKKKWEKDLVLNYNLKLDSENKENKIFTYHVGQSGEVLEIHKNHNTVADGAYVYFDAITTDDIPGPNPPNFYVHVLINVDSLDLTDQNLALAYKYRKWFNKRKDQYLTGMNWHQQIFIIVTDSWPEQQKDPNALYGFMEAYFHSHGQPMEINYTLVIYDVNDL